jgi:hypothetical protein
MVYIVLCDIMYNMELSHLYYHQYKMHIFWAVVIFHIAVIVAVLVTPLFLKLKIHFQIMICIYLLLIVQWNVLGHCILSYWENKTDPIHMPNLKQSYVHYVLEKSLGHHNYIDAILRVTFVFMITYMFIRVVGK